MFNKILFSNICILLLLIPWHINAQNFTGTKGLVTIPSADFNESGELLFSISSLDKRFNGVGEYKYNAVVGYLNFGFLPFMEVGLKLTYPFDHPRSALGDRTFYFRIKFINETENLPQIVLGVHDPIGPGGGDNAIHNNSLYLVATKHFAVSKMNDISLTLGYGSDLIKAEVHQFIGLFGGASFDFLSHRQTDSLFTIDYSLLLEYDAERFNGGVRITLFDHVKILAGLMEMRYLSGGVSVSMKL
ncbi:MAG: YjbH domain-containing protein [Bacteroidetes bacterium]|nr:YjbH domain-containing protein [Bacteroidota bacterium]